MNRWHYHAPYVAGLAMVLWAIALSASIVQNHALSPWGQGWFLVAALTLLTLVPWRRAAITVVAFFLRHAPHAHAVGAAARPHMQAARQAAGRGAQNLLQRGVAAVQWLLRKALENRLLTFGILLTVYAGTLFSSEGPSLRAFLILLAGIGCVVLHYSVRHYGARRVRRFFIRSVVWMVGKLVQLTGWVVKQISKFLHWALTKLMEFMIQLYSGKWGWDVTCLATSAMLFGIGMLCLLVPSLQGSTMTISGVAVSVGAATLVASPFLFVAAVMLGAKKHLVK